MYGIIIGDIDPMDPFPTGGFLVKYNYNTNVVVYQKGFTPFGIDDYSIYQNIYMHVNAGMLYFSLKTQANY